MKMELNEEERADGMNLMINFKFCLIFAIYFEFTNNDIFNLKSPLFQMGTQVETSRTWREKVINSE